MNPILLLRFYGLLCLTYGLHQSLGPVAVGALGLTILVEGWRK